MRVFSMRCDIVISGNVDCGSDVCGSLLVCLFSSMCSELLIISEIV